MSCTKVLYMSSCILQQVSCPVAIDQGSGDISRFPQFEGKIRLAHKGLTSVVLEKINSHDAEVHRKDHAKCLKKNPVPPGKNIGFFRIFPEEKIRRNRGKTPVLSRVEWAGWWERLYGPKGRACVQRKERALNSIG